MARKKCVFQHCTPARELSAPPPHSRLAKSSGFTSIPHAIVWYGT